MGKDDSDAGGVSGMLNMLFGVAGIYGAFMYYGYFQESITKFKTPEGDSLGSTWFLQTVEAACNVLVGGVGLLLTGGANLQFISLKKFGVTGTSQVMAKAFTTQAMIYGVSFPVATLAKSAKMVPVMIGSILINGTSYTLRKYLQVAMIVGGTVMVNMAKKKSSGSSETVGLICLAIALICDGLTGGLQASMKADYLEKSKGQKIKPYELMTFTNIAMMVIAFAVALATSQFFSGLAFVMAHPELMFMVGKWGLCSAIGQSFIFFTIATFDPLVTTTVTTTRKIFSVLLSIFAYGHSIAPIGWAGIGLASLGILGEMTAHSKKASPVQPKKL